MKKKWKAKRRKRRGPRGGGVKWRSRGNKCKGEMKYRKEEEHSSEKFRG